MVPTNIPVIVDNILIDLSFFLSALLIYITYLIVHKSREIRSGQVSNIIPTQDNYIFLDAKEELIYSRDIFLKVERHILFHVEYSNADWHSSFSRSPKIPQKCYIDLPQHDLQSKVGQYNNYLPHTNSLYKSLS